MVTLAGRTTHKLQIYMNRSGRNWRIFFFRMVKPAYSQPGADSTYVILRLRNFVNDSQKSDDYENTTVSYIFYLERKMCDIFGLSHS